VRTTNDQPSTSELLSALGPHEKRYIAFRFEQSSAEIAADTASADHKSSHDE
jgi:hypothetical protein